MPPDLITEHQFSWEAYSRTTQYIEMPHMLLIFCLINVKLFPPALNLLCGTHTTQTQNFVVTNIIHNYLRTFYCKNLWSSMCLVAVLDSNYLVWLGSV